MPLRRWRFSDNDDDTGEDPAGYQVRLSELAAALRGTPWLLAGGMTIPLQLGQFYRSHVDIDVAFPIEAFPEITKAFERAGYYLGTYMPMSFFGLWRTALNIPVRHDGWVVKRRPRKLRFLDATGARKAPHLLASIDCFPYRIADGNFVSCDGKYRFPLVRPIAGHTFMSEGGDPISCLDLHYVTRIKQMLPGTKHALDVSMVARHFPSHVGAESD